MWILLSNQIKLACLAAIHYTEGLEHSVYPINDTVAIQHAWLIDVLCSSVDLYQVGCEQVHVLNYKLISNPAIPKTGSAVSSGLWSMDKSRVFFLLSDQWAVSKSFRLLLSFSVQSWYIWLKWSFYLVWQERWEISSILTPWLKKCQNISVLLLLHP